MSTDPREHDERLPLDALGPSEGFLQGLPALGHRAAQRQADPLDLRGAARWFLPAAACAAAACWLTATPARPGAAGPTPLAAATDLETLVDLSLGGRP